MKTRILPRLFSGALCLSALCLTSAASAATLGTVLDENPMSANRLTQDLPNQSAWYSSGSASSVSVSNGRYIVNAGNHLVTYFTAAGKPVSLDVGQTLQVSFSFQVSGIVANSASPIRFGLFNSGDNRISADGGGSTNAAYEDYTGYAAFLRQGGTESGTIQLRQRNADLATGLIHSGGAYAALGNAGGSAATFQNNVLYSSVYQLTRTSAGMEISVSITGGGLSGVTHSYLVTGDIYNAFDTFALYAGGNTQLTSYSIDGISIAVVPEPGSASLALGAAAIGLVFWMRKYRSK